MSIFCKHNWCKADKHVFDPPVKVAQDAGMDRVFGGMNTLVKQKVVYIYTCDKCGDLRKVESVHP